VGGLAEGKLHKKTRHNIVKIGKLEGYDAKTEWSPDEKEAFDGAWIPAGSETPTHVFEVQVEGSKDKAIGKLMRARKRWANCEIRLVAPKNQVSELMALTQKTLGTHDWKACKVIDAATINGIIRHLTRVRDLRGEIGYEPRH